MNYSHEIIESVFMKVGIFLGNFKPEVGGGYTFENEVFQSLVELSSKTHHTFVLFGWSKEPPQELSFENIEYISIPRDFVRSKLSQIAIRFFKIGDHTELEKFILMCGVEIMWYLTPFVCLTKELPYITIVWDLQHRLQPFFPEVSTRGRWDSRERLFSLILRRASVVIAGTKAGKNEIERFYQVPADRIRILPHPTPRVAPDAPPSDGKQVLAKYNLPEGYLFYPANFWSHKNHVGLLLAVKLLRENYNLVFPVVFVGSDQGNLQYIKQRVAELNLSTQVHFLGFVPREDLISLYRNAFALTYLTFFGPENLPPLEAFALGCPVITSNVSGAQEQLGDAALLVDPKDHNQIALAIKSLHEDRSLRHTLIQRGLQRAQRWTGKDYVKGVFSILDEFEPIRRCWGKDVV
jgi:glycosyltransferase involved in cell wall biosynthesis